MPSVFHRHFTFKHPLFRKKESASGEWWEDSVYYLWWEFLRRHEGYKKTCQNGGNGRYANLYADFGNVHDLSFKDWWSEGNRGAKLFAEPPLPNSLAEIGPDEVDGLKDALTSGAVMVIAIPLTLRKRYILKRFNELLSKRHTRRRGQRTFPESRALYPIATTFNVQSLKKILDVYDLHKAESELPQWQIAQRLKIGTILDKDELEANTGVGKKSVLSVTVSKKLALAKRIIDGVGKGIFPANSTRKSAVN
jgi:hypothetical protein